MALKSRTYLLSYAGLPENRSNINSNSTHQKLSDSSLFYRCQVITLVFKLTPEQVWQKTAMAHPGGESSVHEVPCLVVLRGPGHGGGCRVHLVQ